LEYFNVSKNKETRSKTMETMKSWMTQDELRRKWDVSPQTVRDWREQGLPCYKVGKKVCFIESEVISFIKEKQAITTSKKKTQTHGNTNSEITVSNKDDTVPSKEKTTRRKKKNKK
jgi:hypothetical protein